MNLDELRRRVTEANLRAESMPPGLETRRAFREVAELEEEIAAVCGVTTIEGEAARLGAITAALRADEPLRALQLADRYDGSELSEPARAELEALVAEANELLDTPSTIQLVGGFRFVPAA